MATVPSGCFLRQTQPVTSGQPDGSVKHLSILNMGMFLLLALSVLFEELVGFDIEFIY